MSINCDTHFDRLRERKISAQYIYVCMKSVLAICAAMLLTESPRNPG